MDDPKKSADNPSSFDFVFSPGSKEAKEITKPDIEVMTLEPKNDTDNTAEQTAKISEPGLSQKVATPIIPTTKDVKLARLQALNLFSKINGKTEKLLLY